MKNLANCGPREFLMQTVKIRHAVEHWLKATEIMEIRKRLPEYPEGATKAERAALTREQGRKNLWAMFDAIAEKHPAETAELLALCCFVEPEKADEHPMSEYLGSFAEMIENEDVWRFFTSLMRLGQTIGLKV